MADLNSIQADLPTGIIGLSTAGVIQTPVGSDTQGNLQTTTPDNFTTTTALGALNASVQLDVHGLTSVGFQLLAGTLIGTLTPQCSLDGGTTWVTCSFYDPSNSTVSTSLTFASANTLKVISILPIGGASNVRVIVTAYTSGTANSLLRASLVTGAAGAVTAAAFGTVNNTYPSVTVNTATLILSANINRKYAIISNNSGSLVSIQLGSATGLTSNARGIVVPNNQYFQLQGSNLFTGAIYAYTTSSGVTLSVTEGTP